MKNVTVLGTTNDVTACEHCGRTELKGTVALEIDGFGPVYYGVICAARATGRKPAAIRKAADAADASSRRAAADAAYYVSVATTHASATIAAALSAYFVRNRGATDGVVYVSPAGFYAVPADASDKIAALTAGGWTAATV